MRICETKLVNRWLNASLKLARSLCELRIYARYFATVKKRASLVHRRISKDAICSISPICLSKRPTLDYLKMELNGFFQEDMTFPTLLFE